ncbi:DUF6112 family protein [Microbacterium rhizophilus]|uniref:DUF6112 family protein n=1 Tax=Microbacterium rhizophilus TaxID=3138934 RepID=UPI0031E532BC
MPQPSPIHRTGILRTDVFPDFGAVGDGGTLADVVGALLTLVLIVAVLMVVVCAIAWALASSAGNYQAATRARIGVWIAVGSAGLAGAGLAWANFLMDVGGGL